MKKLCLLILLVSFSPILAARVPRVLFLDIVNKNNDRSVQYLESSITSAILKKMKKKFVFEQLPREQWIPIAKENYFYKTEWDQKSVSINLGLLTRQDVVISGSYAMEKSGISRPKITVLVRIFNIRKRAMVSEKKISLFVDNRIWDTVDKIAEDAAKEAAGVLPNQEEYRQSVIEGIDYPILERPIVGFSVGGGIFHTGYGEHLSQIFPEARITMGAYTPVITDTFMVESEFSFRREEISTRESLHGVQVQSSTYQAGIGIKAEFTLLPKWFLSPGIGGGAVFRQISVSGIIGDSYASSAAGYFFLSAELSYEWIMRYRAVLGLRSTFFPEVQSYFNEFAYLGIRYEL